MIPTRTPSPKTTKPSEHVRPLVNAPSPHCFSAPIGDIPEAFCVKSLVTEVYSEHSRYVERLVGQRVLADEVADTTQEVWVRVVRSFRTYQGRGMRSWLFRVVGNTVLELARFKRRGYRDANRSVPLKSQAIPALESVASDPFLLDRLERAIHALPRLQRTVFRLKVLSDMNHAEIAKRLGVSVGTSRSSFCRARRRLRDKIGGMYSISDAPVGRGHVCP